MSTAAYFLSQFASDGHFIQEDGSLDVVFTTRGGSRYPGKLHFNNGLCVRAEMERGGDWSNPDTSPLNDLHFLLHFDGEKPHSVLIDRGRVVDRFDALEQPTRREFLSNIRVARNLFFHSPIPANSSQIDNDEVARTLARAAVWLTPKSINGFRVADFPELGPQGQGDLQEAVQDFEAVAKQVPADLPATSEQYQRAVHAVLRILAILNPYLPVPEEAKNVETVLRSVNFPDWIVNWDFELGSDSEGMAALWVNLFVDGASVPLSQLGRHVLELTSEIRHDLRAAGVSRWPYFRVRTAAEHKSAAV